MPPFVSSSSDDKSIRSGHYENATVDDAKDPFFFGKVFVYFSPQQLYFQDSLCIHAYIKGMFIYRQQIHLWSFIGFANFVFKKCYSPRLSTTLFPPKTLNWLYRP